MHEWATTSLQKIDLDKFVLSEERPRGERCFISYGSQLLSIYLNDIHAEQEIRVARGCVNVRCNVIQKSDDSRLLSILQHRVNRLYFIVCPQPPENIYRIQVL